MDGMGKLALPFGNRSKAKKTLEEATRILADAELARRQAASHARIVQQETRKIVDLLAYPAAQVGVTTPDRDYPEPYLLVDAAKAREAIAAWRQVAEAA